MRVSRRIVAGGTNIAPVRRVKVSLFRCPHKAEALVPAVFHSEWHPLD